ncbi:MAG: hypothetical protein LBF40_00685 [Deltaproteobacteria bacterium]|jgi:uncharacterized protein with PIN domain|nr:hypothetical protein [Deltaproteobacteria bacterium]
MISSIITLANNALLYNGVLAANQARYGYQSAGAAQRTEAEKYQESKPDSIEEAKKKKISLSEKFEESLAARLKETGLTGPEASQRIAELTQDASVRVQEVRKEQGDQEANRLMAEILTQASGTDAAQSVAQSLAYATADTKKAGFKDDGQPSSEEIAKRTTKKLERKIAQTQPAAGEEKPGDSAKALEGSTNVFLSVKAAVEDLKLSSPDAESPSVTEFLSLVQKVKADLALTEPPNYAIEAAVGSATAQTLSIAYPGAKGGVNGRTTQHGLGSVVPSAYKQGYPHSGSLVSVTV